MTKNTAIEWADHTFNGWEGCRAVSPGCAHCYAEARNARFGGGVSVNWGPGAPRRRTSAANWKQPLTWEREAAAFMATHGRRQRVFCSSLSDVFDNEVDPQWRQDLFELIEATPSLDWLLLTKRIGNAARMIEGATLPKHRAWPWPNVWLGATIVNQEEADRDIPKLLATPAAKRFLSIEPMLGAVDLVKSLGGTLWIGGQRGCDGTTDGTHYHDERCGPGIDWVICGGESGPKARPMHPDWVRSLCDQCQAAGVPFLFKQWGEWHTNAFLISSGKLVFRQFGTFESWVNKASTWVNGGICLDTHGHRLECGADFMRARDQSRFPITVMHRTGKKAAGRMLDGRTWDGFPCPQ